MIVSEATIEEFEGGSWVADLVSTDKFDGSFDLAGDTWKGTAVSERLEFELYRSKVVGGAGKLSTVLPDKFYSGNVSFQVATQDVCRESGETFGSAPPGVFLSTLERLRGKAFQALDGLAESFSVIWWIGRDGTVRLDVARPVAGPPTGNRVESFNNSVVLSEPEQLTLGSVYDGKPVRHIRWHYNAKRFFAEVYFVPFLFRPPTDTRYDKFYDALVDKDNGDGTIDVIADSRFGITKVKLFCGVPGSKVKMNQGEEVTLGFLGGDKQKPFAVAMAQSPTATKAVARNGDTVQVQISASNIATLAPLITAPPGAAGGPCAPTPPGLTAVTLDGQITSGSERLKVGD